MSDLKEQLIKLGAANKSLRPDIRPILSSLEKAASRVSLDERLMSAKASFADDVFAFLKKALPKILKDMGVKSFTFKRTGTFELMVPVTMARLYFSVTSEGDKIQLAVTVSGDQPSPLSMPLSSTPIQVAKSLIDELKRY